jgi:alpha-beta hydrolase superfamily lysophospholipase
VSAAHHFEVVTTDGVRLSATSRAVPDARVAVVVAHGMSGSKDDPAVAAIADALHATGHAVVTFDSRGHGQSDGQCTLGSLEDRDVGAAVRAARELAPEVVIVGASMGAIAALRYAASDLTVDGVVAVSSPARWRVPRTARGLLAVVFTRTPLGRWAARRFLHVRLARKWIRLDEPVVLAQSLDMPLAVVHGEDDRFVPAAAATEIYFAAGGARRIDVVAGMGHAYDDVSVAAIVEAVEWVASRKRRG